MASSVIVSGTEPCLLVSYSTHSHLLTGVSVELENILTKYNSGRTGGPLFHRYTERVVSPAWNSVGSVWKIWDGENTKKTLTETRRMLRSNGVAFTEYGTLARGCFSPDF